MTTREAACVLACMCCVTVLLARRQLAQCTRATPYPSAIPDSSSGRRRENISATEDSDEDVPPHPSAWSRDAKLIMYNVIPKCASSTVRRHFQRMHKANNFKIVVFPALKEDLAETLTNMSQESDQPILFAFHHPFVDFESLGLPPPPHIQMMRDPVEQQISNYQYYAMDLGHAAESEWNKVSLPAVTLYNQSQLHLGSDCVLTSRGEFGECKKCRTSLPCVCVLIDASLSVLVQCGVCYFPDNEFLSRRHSPECAEEIRVLDSYLSMHGGIIIAHVVYRYHFTLYGCQMMQSCIALFQTVAECFNTTGDCPWLNVFVNITELHHFCGKECTVASEAALALGNVYCRSVTGETVQWAKQHIVKHHSVVGVTEELAGFFDVLEYMHPRYFHGAAREFRKMSAKERTTNVSKHRKEWPEWAKDVLRRTHKEDIEVYRFVQQRFYRHWEEAKKAHIRQ